VAVGRGRRDRRECGHPDLAPAPVRDDVHRIAEPAGLILDARHRGAARTRRHGAPCARPSARTTHGRRPCALGASRAPCAGNAGSSRRRASGSSPRACIGTRSGDNRRGRDQSRCSACAAAGRGETRRACSPRVVADPREATPGAAPSGPRVEETGLFALRATPEGVVIEGIGVSNTVAKAAMALTTEKPVAGPFTVGDNLYIIRLKERKEPDLADFEKRKMELAREAEQAKGERVLFDWAHAACVEAKESRKISINLDALKYGDEQNEQVSYEPCAPPSHRLFGG